MNEGKINSILCNTEQVLKNFMRNHFRGIKKRERNVKELLGMMKVLLDPLKEMKHEYRVAVASIRRNELPMILESMNKRQGRILSIVPFDDCMYIFYDDGGLTEGRIRDLIRDYVESYEGTKICASDIARYYMMEPDKIRRVFGKMIDEGDSFLYE